MFLSLFSYQIHAGNAETMAIMVTMATMTIMTMVIMAMAMAMMATAMMVTAMAMEVFYVSY